MRMPDCFPGSPTSAFVAVIASALPQYARFAGFPLPRSLPEDPMTAQTGATARRDQNLGSLRYTTTAPDPSMRPLPRSLPVNSAMTNGTICRTLLISRAVSAAPEGTLWCHGRDHALHAAALY